MQYSKEKIITHATSYFMSKYSKKYLSLETKTDGLPPCTTSKKYLLYIHVPFCTMFCPYCSFNKFKYTKEEAAIYFKYLRKELLHVKLLGYDFDYLVVGGGTPLIDEEELIKTIELARSLFSIQNVSCETDPNHIEKKTIERLKGLVDRISIGVQSFDDTILKKLGRYEKFGSSQQIYDKIKDILGILPITSVDMIFNFPNQTDSGFKKELEVLKSLSPEQTSIYPLMTSSTVKNSVKKTLGEYSIENEYTFYNIIKSSLQEEYVAQHGWSYSKKDNILIDEYIIDNEEYVGIGSGSFSFLNNTLYLNEFALDKYAHLIQEKGSGTTKQRTFPRKSRMYYRLMVDLFNGTLQKEKFEKEFQANINTELSKELWLLKLSGAIKEDERSISPTDFGSYLFLVLMKEFYMGMDQIRDSERKKIGVI